jgi:hypothetical protein
MPGGASRIHLNLQIEPSADPVRGLVEDAHGHQHPFWGWLELMETVKALADEVSNASPSSQSSRGAVHDAASTMKHRPHTPKPPGDASC